MKCTQCGAELQEGTPICPKCGEHLAEQEAAAPNAGRTLNMPEHNPLRKSVAKGIVGLVVVVALVVAFVLFGVPAIQHQLNPASDASTASSAASSDPANASASSKDAITPTDAAASAAQTVDSVGTIAAKNMTLTLSVGEQAVKVSFPQVEGAVNYRVAYRASGASDWSYQWSEGQTSTVVENLNKNGAYEFQVAAYAIKDGAWVRGAYSDSACGWLQSTTATLTAGSGSFTAKAAAVEGASSYELIYATSKDGLAQGTTVTMTGTETTVTGLQAGTTYYVKIRPVTSVNGIACPGAYSDVATVAAG